MSSGSENSVSRYEEDTSNDDNSNEDSNQIDITDTNTNQNPSLFAKFDLNKFCFKYLQYFREDDNGIPPGCHHRLCPLDHRNIYLNKSLFAHQLGKIGTEYADKNRKAILGIATLFTIFAMAMTTYGCFSLSTVPSIVQRTYWAAGSVKNETSGNEYALYIGLRAVVFIDCAFEPGYDINDYNPSKCQKQEITWTDSSCQTQPLIESACVACANIATQLWLTAFMSCATLILALLGTQTRMRVLGDVPVQKLLGMGSEVWGSLSLAVALGLFEHDCLYGIKVNFELLKPIRSSFWLGPGYICYLICCISGFIRAIAHWVIPMPQQGEGLKVPLYNLLVLLCKCDYHIFVDTYNNSTQHEALKNDDIVFNPIYNSCCQRNQDSSVVVPIDNSKELYLSTTMKSDDNHVTTLSII